MHLKSLREVEMTIMTRIERLLGRTLRNHPQIDITHNKNILIIYSFLFLFVIVKSFIVPLLCY